MNAHSLHHQLDSAPDSQEGYKDGLALLELVHDTFATKSLTDAEWKILQRLVGNHQTIFGTPAFPKMISALATLTGECPDGTWSLSFTNKQGMELNFIPKRSHETTSHNIGVENEKFAKYIKKEYGERKLTHDELENLRNLVLEHKETFKIPDTSMKEAVQPIMGDSVEGPWLLTFNKVGMSFSPASKKVGDTRHDTQGRIETILEKQ